MKTFIFQQLRNLEIPRLWLMLLVLAEVIVAITAWLLYGYVPLDYLLTGFITSSVMVTLFVVVTRQFREQFFETELQLRTIIETEPECVKLLTKDGLLLRINQAGLDMIEADSLEQVIGQRVQNIVLAEYRAAFIALTRKVFDGESGSLEFEIQGLKGTRRWLDTHAVPLRDKDGNISALLGITRDITDRKRTEDALKVREERFQALFDRASEGILVVSPNGKLLTMNESFARMHGYTVQEMQAMSLYDLDTPDSLSLLPERLQRVLSGESLMFEVEHYHKDGHAFPLEVSISLVISNGEQLLQSFVRDISERKQIETQLRIAATVFESQEGMLITDADNIILKANRAFTKMTGYSEAEVIGKKPQLLSSGQHDAKFYATLWQSLADTGTWQGEIWNRRKNGECYPEWLTITAVKGNNDEAITHYVATSTDTTKIKATEDHINRLAFYDYLTQLPNRRLLQERLKHGIDMNHSMGGQMAVLMMDLDKFKSTNDNFGHLAGDELLQQVATRLKACVREADTVARLGGDEFVILMENIGQYENDVARVAEDVISSLEQPFTLFEHHKAYISVSVGIAIYPQHGDSAETLMDNVDTALYHAKDSGRGCFAYFSEALTQKARERIALEFRLRHALARQELQVYFQPQIDIASEQIVGAEALVRWHDPINGHIPPNAFIPLAEETGLIVAIGEFVLQETCRLGQQWLNAGLPAITLAVNVSPHQFRRCDINALVATVLRDTGFPASHLELEITESGLMDNQQQVMTILNNLHEQGVRLAIDDFGTGYSSLAYLKYFPLDVLKIDKTFIDDIPFLQGDMAITATIIAMAHHLGFKVLAEGVENKEQLAFLQEHGCNSYQGYLYSKAVPACDFVKLLSAAVKQL